MANADGFALKIIILNAITYFASIGLNELQPEYFDNIHFVEQESKLASYKFILNMRIAHLQVYSFKLSGFLNV